MYVLLGRQGYFINYASKFCKVKFSDENIKKTKKYLLFCFDSYIITKDEDVRERTVVRRVLFWHLFFSGWQGGAKEMCEKEDYHEWNLYRGSKSKTDGNV